MFCHICGKESECLEEKIYTRRYSHGTFVKLFECENGHYIRLCNVCGVGKGVRRRHFDEKICETMGYLAINCGNSGGEKDKLLFCKDVIDIIPHAFCFKRDYDSIAKKLHHAGEANVYDNGTGDIHRPQADRFIFITKYSECFRDLINILTSDDVDCNVCGYSFDSFPTLQMFQEHLEDCRRQSAAPRGSPIRR